MKTAKKVLKVLTGLIVILGIVVLLIFQMPSFGGSFEGARLEKMEKSPEFIGGRFENTPKQNIVTSVLSTFKLYQQGFQREPLFDIPVDKIDPNSLTIAPAPGLRTFWFGHASVLTEIDGVRGMTDPVLSERVSPLTFVGPKRFHAPPISLDALSGIDFVVISHDHYDLISVATPVTRITLKRFTKSSAQLI